MYALCLVTIIISLTIILAIIPNLSEWSKEKRIRDQKQKQEIENFRYENPEKTNGLSDDEVFGLCIEEFNRKNHERIQNLTDEEAEAELIQEVLKRPVYIGGMRIK